MTASDESGLTRDDRLYRLLPGIHRSSDSAHGQPLRALFRVLAESVNVIEDDIGRLYQNAFIELCDDWAVSYVAAPVGFRPPEGASVVAALAPDRRTALTRALAPRRLAANALRRRREKGTLTTLEELAADVGDWIARAVETGRLVERTAHPQFLHPGRSVLPRAWDTDAIDRIGGPFDALPRLLDVRGAGAGAVTLYVWRSKVHRVDRVRAGTGWGRGVGCQDEPGRDFTFSPVGNDEPLFNRPDPSRDPTGATTELEVPAPIRLEALRRHTTEYYGVGRSFTVWRRDPGRPQGDDDDIALVPLDAAEIVPADLSGATPKLRPGQLAVDPATGRMRYEPRNGEDPALWVTYHRGFAADLGGGDYRRDPATLEPVPADQSRVARAFVRKLADPPGEPTEPVDVSNPPPIFHTILEALVHVRAELDRLGGRGTGLVEVLDDSVYDEHVQVNLPHGRTVIVRAGEGCRPVVWLSGSSDARPNALGTGGTLVLEGLWFAGGRLVAAGVFERLTLRHCTLVGGSGRPGAPGSSRGLSLELARLRGRFLAEACLLGPITVDHDDRGHDPPALEFVDSAVDVGDGACHALAAGRHAVAYARLTVRRCTFTGGVQVHALDLAEDSLFVRPVIVARRQSGVMRWCYVAPGRSTPRRVGCQPDSAVNAAGLLTAQDAGVEAAAPALAVGPEGVLAPLLMAGRVAEAEADAFARVVPRFASLRFGNPLYLLLAEDAPEEISRGAQDRSEVGVFHDLFFPQRLANLDALVAEFTPAEFRTTIVFVD